MSQYAMPLLIINMGGEMVYILEQRLQAQSVPLEKSKRVLQDVIRTMYNPKFIIELFKPQEIYSMHSTRQIFDRLAHSSIMRLNESSMDKLFDLMTMGFKYQLVSCTHPGELLQVTLNHLEALRSKVDDNAAVTELVDSVIRSATERYSNMSAGDFGMLRQNLCRFFQDKRVKVSLFLQDGIQNLDGTIALSSKGNLPPGVDMPGLIRYLDPSGGEVGMDHFTYPGASELQPASGANPLDASTRPCKLGLNLYNKEKSSAPTPAKKDGDAAPAPVAAAAATRNAAPPESVPNSTAKAEAILASSGGKAAQASQELNLLASLIAPDAKEPSAFKINLFPDTDVTAPGKGTAMSQTITIDFAKEGAMKDSNQGLVDIMDSMNVGGGGQDDGDDLLDLMDSAS